MLNTILVVWRESLEAILVVGILLAWIARQPARQHLRRGVWLGVLAGIGLAMLLGYATFFLQSQMQGDSLELFQAGMAFFAALLILQMVLWMKKHGRAMRAELEASAAHAGSMLGLAAITALAVAREGAETVIFLYGVGMDAENGGWLQLFGGACIGLALALTFSWLIARGARFLNYRTLFVVSQIFLLIIANALIANGVDRLIGMDKLPALLDPAWDISWLLDDAGGIGHILADFAGYRARPTGTLLLGCGAFWFLACIGYWWSGRTRPSARSAVVSARG